MLRRYHEYYRRYGIRRAMQLLAPKLHSITKLTLPKEAAVHYLATEGERGIASNDPLLSDVKGPVYANNIVELATNKGNPRRTAVQFNKMIMDYHRKNRRIRKISDIDKVINDGRSVIINNYSLLTELYRYTSNVYSPYNKWYNVQKTLMSEINKIAAKSNRPQFISCHLPVQLPSKIKLMKGTGKVTTRFMSMFPDHESLFILELWKWIGEQRDQSILNDLSDDAIKNLNLIWMDSGVWFVINLGELDGWRKKLDEEAKVDAEDNQKGIPAKSLQNRFLRLLMFLQDERNRSEDDAYLKSDDMDVVDEDETGGDIDAGSDTTTKSSDTFDGPRVQEQDLTIDVDNDPDEDKDEVTLDETTDLSEISISDVEETAANNAKIDEILERDLATLNELEQVHVDNEKESAKGLDLDESEEPKAKGILDENRSLSESIIESADYMADMGMLSAAEYRRFTRLSTAYKDLPNPYTGEGSLEDLTHLDQKDLEVKPEVLAKEIEGVTDESYLSTTLKNLDKKYLDNVLPKDIVHSVLSVQNAGIAVTGYKVEDYKDAINNYEMHSVQLTPVNGKTSTVHFKIPKIGDDGIYVANDVKYRLAKQRVDLPIRKVNPSRVALTSYYAKVFINRSEKKKYNYSAWISNHIRSLALGDDSVVSNIMLSNVYNSNDHVPRIYSILAQSFRSFSSHQANFLFDHDAREKLFNKDLIKSLEKKGFVLTGSYGKRNKQPIIVGPDNVFYRVDPAGDLSDLIVMGTIEQLLDIDESKKPVELIDIKVSGKQIPIGLFLAYILGYQAMLDHIGIKPIRTVAQGERLSLSNDEIAITFEDEKQVFSNDGSYRFSIINSLASCNRHLANYGSVLFDDKAIYFNVLSQMGLGIRYTREMDLMTSMFIDPITKGILETMQEPTTFIGLLVRACELLETDWAPDEPDLQYQRIRGYERIAGTVYQELVKAIRLQKARNNKQAAVEVNPQAVWINIMQDGSKRLIEESNPIHELKGAEEITYGGAGGRSGRSLVSRSRIFHDNDLGVVSEATKDSADVAVSAYMVANPNIINLRGMTKKHAKDDGAASAVSTSALLAPAADRDDGKRINYIQIQNSSSTFVKDNRIAPLRTGYEKAIAHRTSDLFAYTAEQDGKITKKNNRVIEITYKDGSKKAIELGNRLGYTPDLKIPQEVVTTLDEGDTVKQGDIVTYNDNYFNIDPLNKKQVALSMSTLLNTALMESPETLEDASVISEKAADKLVTRMAVSRDITVEFAQGIHEMVAIGDHVEVYTPLCLIEDPLTIDSDLFSEDTVDTLKVLSSNAPKAKYAGTISKIECYYHGDMEDMSESLKDITHESNLRRRRLSRDMGEDAVTGQVNDEMHIDGKPLLLDHAVIKVIIEMDVPVGIGD